LYNTIFAGLKYINCYDIFDILNYGDLVKKISIIITTFIFLASCQGNEHTRPNSEQSTQSTNPEQPTEPEQQEQLGDYFSCDSTTPLVQVEEDRKTAVSPSVLFKATKDGNTDELSLTQDELKTLHRELSILLSDIWATNSDDRIKINAAKKLISSIEKSNFTPSKIDTNILKEATIVLKNIYSHFDQRKLLHLKIFPRILDIKLGSKNREDELLGKYLALIAEHYLGKNFDDSIAMGLLADPKIAWKVVVEYSPILRKFLQRRMETLKEDTQEEKNHKHFLLSLLRSHPFVATANDRHVKALKQHFGDNITVSGLAKASVGEVYLIKCKKNGQDKAFVAKTAIFTPTELKNKIQEELGLIDNIHLLRTLYPELKAHGLKADLDVVKQDIIHEISKEIDLPQENKNLKELSISYKKDPEINIVKGELRRIKSEDYLLMEYIPGTILSSITKLDKKQAVSLNKALKGLYDHIMKQKGYYHADTHEGNIIIDNNGKVTLIDAGHINAPLDNSLIPFLRAFEEAFLVMNTMNLDRSGNQKDPLFSTSQQQKIKEILSKYVNLKLIGLGWEFGEYWNLFFEKFTKDINEPFREFFIRYMTGLPKLTSNTEDLKPVFKALRAIDLLDNIYHRLLKDHNMEYFFGLSLPR